MKSKDMSLVGAEYVIDLDGEMYTITLEDMGNFYGIKIYNSQLGRELESNVFTDEVIPRIYDESDVQKVIDILFEEVAKVPRLSDIGDPDDWHTGVLVQDIEDDEKRSNAIAAVNQVIAELHEVTMMDSSNRNKGALFVRYGDIVAKIEFKLANGD